MRKNSAKHRDDLALTDLVFLGFNSRVVALDRETGQVVWSWKSPKGTGFPSVLLDGDRLVVSIHGYTYCLDPLDGTLLWSNPLKGMGVGTPSLCSIYGNSGSVAAAAIIAESQRQASHQSTTTT